jgi:hypothetical protein
MSPLSRTRASRDEWKVKNKVKRKKINQLERKATAFEANASLREAKIHELKLLLENLTPQSIDIAKELQRLKEETQRQKEESQRQREEIQRLSDDNDKQQEEIEKLKKELESKRTVSCSPSPRSAQVLCVYLLITCGVSFRSISKILQALIDLGFLRDFWVPHFTSVINWTLRVGIDLLNQVGAIPEPWIAIMDTSIDIGTRKAVVIIRVRLSAIGDRGSAITLQDCQVIFLKIVENCDGEIISECLETAFDRSGKPIAVLKDGGSDLKKGTSIYREENNCKRTLWTIADLGHVIANALKAEFAKLLGFKRLLALVYGGAKRLRQTHAAVFLPPKLRTKGRFQGISRLAEWAIWILDLMAVQGQTKDGSLVAILRKGFPKLPRLRALIEKFAATCKIMNDFQFLMKNQGLNQETYRQGLLILNQLPELSRTRQIVQKWLDQHLGLQCRLAIGQTPLLVSSDAIESLMGKLKSTLGRSSIAELNRMTLILPTLCGKVTPDSIDVSLRRTTHMDLLKTEKDVIPITLLQQRKRTLTIFKYKKEVPKTSPLKMTG